MYPITSDNPLVSVIVPCYNSSDYIEGGIRSLCEQDYENIEILVIDDFSTDKSRDCVSQYQANDSRIKLILNTEKGANRARELGVRSASGEYLIFMDADDSWQFDGVSTLINCIKSSGADLVCCNMLRITEKSRVKLFTYPQIRNLISLDSDPKYLASIPPSACAKIFKSNLFSNITFMNTPFAQDWNITYKYAARAKSVLFIDDPLYLYNVRDHSTSSHMTYADGTHLLLAEKCILDIDNHFKQECRDQLFEKELALLNVRFYLNLLGRAHRILNESEKKRIYQHIRRKFLGTRKGWISFSSVLSRSEYKKGLLLLVMFISYFIYKTSQAITRK